MVVQESYNMNIIINKLNLPCDLKNEIYKYNYNSEGYTVDDLASIDKQKNKKRSQFIKLRIKLELALWYKWGYNVSYLKGGGYYGEKHPREVFGGGTLQESQHLRYYNGITSYSPSINDPDNDYIKKHIEEGDQLRGFIVNNI